MKPLNDDERDRLILKLRRQLKHQRTALRQLNKAHVVLWKVIKLNSDSLIEARKRWEDVHENKTRT